MTSDLTTDLAAVQKPANASVTLTLGQHGMACPSCLQDDALMVSFTGTARLTANGSEDCGDHEWTATSPCRCGNCGFSALVMAFEMGEDGEDVTIPVHDPDPYPEKDPEDIASDAETEIAFELRSEKIDGLLTITVTRSICGAPKVIYEHKCKEPSEIHSQTRTLMAGFGKLLEI